MTIHPGNLRGKKEGRLADPGYEPVRPSRADAAAYDEASLHLPLASLDSGQCRFAVNDAAQGEQHLFCGHAALRGRYCEHHASRVFTGHWAALEKVGAA